MELIKPNKLTKISGGTQNTAAYSLFACVFFCSGYVGLDYNATKLIIQGASIAPSAIYALNIWYVDGPTAAINAFVNEAEISCYMFEPDEQYIWHSTGKTFGL